MHDTATPFDRSVGEFIDRWQASGAAERANYALFLTQLCDVLGVPEPDPTIDDPQKNVYVFERDVTFDQATMLVESRPHIMPTMRYRLRTLLAEPWLRFRLSLLSLLLGSTLVAVVVAHWFAAREVDRLRLQVAALRAENKGHRDRLGILTITDAALAHAIYSPQFRTLNTWQWKFYAPEGRRFRLCLAYDGIVLDGVVPAADARIVVLADNLPDEGAVTCSIRKGGTNDPQAGHVIVHLDRITKKVDLPQDSSAWVRPTIQFEKEIGGEKGTINAAAGRPLVLLRLRGYRVTEVEQNGVKARPRLPPDDSPGPGVLLWIEEQPSSLTAAS